MKPTVILLLLLALPVALLAQLRDPTHPTPLVFTHVTVIDATGAPAQPDMTVVIAKERITVLDKTGTVPIPPEGQIVDATGKFLIPGLWDMHVHTASDLNPGGKEICLSLFIANGVTGVRDMGGDLDALQQWRREISQGTLVGPRIVVSGPMLDGPIPAWPNSIAVATAPEGREAVVALKQQGADFVKVQSLLPREAYFAVAAEAKKQGLPLAGHVPDAVSAAEAADVGQRSMEHLFGVPLGDANDAKATALFASFVKNNTWHCPTLILTRSRTFIEESPGASDSWLRYIPVTWEWPARKERMLRGRTAADIAASGQWVYQKRLALVGVMHREGVRLLAGTDTPAPYVFPGFSLHEELELLVQAGLTPLEVLQSTTRNPAQYLGMLDRLGTVEQAKFADLVLLDANPLDEISNTKKIAAVVVGGKLFTKDALQTLLANVEAAASKR